MAYDDPHHSGWLCSCHQLNGWGIWWRPHYRPHSLLSSDGSYIPVTKLLWWCRASRLQDAGVSRFILAENKKVCYTAYRSRLSIRGRPCKIDSYLIWYQAEFVFFSYCMRACRSLWVWGVSDPKTRYSTSSIIIPNFVALRQSVWASVGVPKKTGDAEEHLTHAKFSHSRSNNYGHQPENFDPSRPAFQGHSRSLDPTWIDRLHLLLVIHSNHGPVSYRFREKKQ